MARFLPRIRGHIPRFCFRIPRIARPMCTESVSPPLTPADERALKILDEFDHHCHINWYPGHMAKALRLLRENLSSAQFIVEVRDARIPISSANPELDNVIKNKRRLIVFNKADLISNDDRQKLKKWAGVRGHDVAMTNALDQRSIRKVVPIIQKLAKPKYKSIPTLAAIIGFPNVGKSSLINSFRQHTRQRKGGKNGGRNMGRLGGGAAQTGANPGVTRHLQGFMVSESPPVFLIDTPGIMAKNFKTPSENLKGIRLAVTGCIKDHLIGPETLALYLHFHLFNQFGNGYFEALGMERESRGITGEIPVQSSLEQVFKHVLGHGSSSELSDGDRARAANKFLQLFRQGQIGRYMLDCLEEF